MMQHFFHYLEKSRESSLARWMSHLDTREDYGEVREITIGMITETVVVAVVHTDRDGSTR